MSIRSLRVLVVLFAGLCAALPAQGGKPAKGDKPKAEKPAKAKEKTPAKEAAAPKDDAVTAKDPVIVAIDKFRKDKVSTKRADWKSSLPAPPAVTFAPDHEYFWNVQTSKGLLVIKLLPDAAPQHVASTIYLARCGFYDDLKFPRILKGFMAQGGSPSNTQSGSAGYAIQPEVASGRKHDAAGTLSAANAGTPGAEDGSQFFITFVPAHHLDGQHTVYGTLTDGMPVLQQIEACGVQKDGETMTDVPSIVHSWITVTVAAKAPADGKAPAGKAPAGK